MFSKLNNETDIETLGFFVSGSRIKLYLFGVKTWQAVSSVITTSILFLTKRWQAGAVVRTLLFDFSFYPWLVMLCTVLEKPVSVTVHLTLLFVSVSPHLILLCVSVIAYISSCLIFMQNNQSCNICVSVPHVTGLFSFLFFTLTHYHSEKAKKYIVKLQHTLYQPLLNRMHQVLSSYIEFLLIQSGFWYFLLK